MMKKADVVSAMAEKAGLTRAQAKKALEAFLGSVSNSLQEGKEVRLVGFGSFVPVRRAAGVARNPKTGEAVQKAASSSCRFRVGERLRQDLNGK